MTEEAWNSHISAFTKRGSSPLEDMVDMFLFSLGVDEDVIQEDKDMFVEHLTEHIIDKSLEDNRQD